MRIYNAYTRAEREPVLLAEGFSLGAALFGPFWLLAGRAWIAAALLLCLEVALVLAVPQAVLPWCLLALAWLVGLCGRDLVGWSLEAAGHERHVVAARDAEAAYARLLAARPELIPDLLEAAGR